MIANIRRRIGGANVTDVSNADLTEYLTAGLEWLAESLHYRCVTWEHLGMTASQQEYPLPEDMLLPVFVEWNGNRLTPSSIYTWDRSGTKWRGATAATPREYAIFARKLILMPPPSSDAITTDSALTMRYIASAEPLGEGGVPGLTDGEQRLACYHAAWEYLVNHPSEENMARAGGYRTLIEKFEAEARRRRTQPHDNEFAPGFKPAVSRIGAAR